MSFSWKNHARVLSGVAGIAFILSLAACAETIAGPSGIADQTTISGVWKLQSLTRSDSTVVNVGDPNRFTLEFAEGGSRLALRADCNRGSGASSTDGRTLTIGSVAVTRAFCTETAPFDDEYLRVLGGESAVIATASSLELSSPRGTLRFGR